MGFKVIGLGEVLWDLLPSGRQLGGAPANFAYHAQALGAQARLITRVGNDPLGLEILGRLRAMGLATGAVQIDQCVPTGTVTVQLDAQGVPQFTIHENVAWDQLATTEEAIAEVKQADALCFGSLAQRNPVSREAIQGLVGAGRRSALRVFDVNLRQSYFSRPVLEQSLQLANVCKLNDAELPILKELFTFAGSERKQIESLVQRFDLRVVALTRGAQGSLLYQEGRWSEQSPRPVKVVDTVGAGDGFTAALVMGLLQGMDLDQIHAIASEVAGFICSSPGATPELPERLRGKF